MLLGLAIAAGALIGFAGERITSRQEWYLAIPLLVAIGWLFVANPDEGGGGHCSSRDTPGP